VAWDEAVVRVCEVSEPAADSGATEAVMSSSTADWAVRYIGNHHLALVEIPLGHKAPVHQGWNQPGGYVTDVCDVSERSGGIHDHGIGAVLGPSGLCSLDIDAPDHALPVLGALGIDLRALREVTPTIQADPSRAPPGVVHGSVGRLRSWLLAWIFGQ
jgi:putative DNA primase/helicase